MIASDTATIAGSGARIVSYPNSVWRSELQSDGYVGVPVDNRDTAYRTLQERSISAANVLIGLGVEPGEAPLDERVSSEALPMCGVTTTFFSARRSGETLGSNSNTSIRRSAVTSR